MQEVLQEAPQEQKEECLYVEVGIFALPSAIEMELIYAEEMEKTSLSLNDIMARFEHCASPKLIEEIIMNQLDWSIISQQHESDKEGESPRFKVEKDVRQRFSKYFPQWKKHRLAWLKLGE